MKNKTSLMLGIILLTVSQLIIAFPETVQGKSIGTTQYVFTDDEKEVLELALSQDDGAKAAGLVNSLENDQAYEIAMEEILNLYYKDDKNLDSRLEDFSTAMDGRGTEIIANYKEAWNERIAGSKSLGYIPDEILVAFKFAISDDDILDCINSIAAGGKIFSKTCNEQKSVVVKLKKSQTTQKAIELFESTDGVIYAERNTIGYIPEKDFPTLTLNKETLSLYKNQTKKLTAALSKGKSKFLWSSKNPSIAKVDKNGKVTGKRKGTTVITVTCADKSYISASCIVKVSDTEKVSVKGKTIVSDYITKGYKNQLITSYTQMKNLIKKYKSTGCANSKVLKQMNTYDKNYFKKYSLCFSTFSKTNGYKISIGNVYLKQNKNGTYKVQVNINVKKPDKNKGYTTDMKTHFCFVQISKTIGQKSKSVTFK